MLTASNNILGAQTYMSATFQKRTAEARTRTRRCSLSATGKWACSHPFSDSKSSEATVWAVRGTAMAHIALEPSWCISRASDCKTTSTDTNPHNTIDYDDYMFSFGSSLETHWLPVNYRIQFKLSTLTYRDLAIHHPPYLASLLHFSNIPRQLRS